jgi:hypothetical protein
MKSLQISEVKHNIRLFAGARKVNLEQLRVNA